MNINDFRSAFMNISGINVQESITSAAVVSENQLNDFKIVGYTSKVIDQICAIYHVNEHLAKLTYDSIAKNYIETQVGSDIIQDDYAIKALYEVVFENNLEFVHCFCVELKCKETNFKSQTCMSLKINNIGEILCAQFDVVSNALGSKQIILALNKMAAENGNVVFMRHWV